MGNSNLALSVKYESLSGIEVTLDAQTVRNYLTRGDGSIIDQECAFFLRTCQARKLDPMEDGEVWLIKYDNNKPAQMVVGYHAYIRRAEQFPEYRGFKAGIVVLRGDSKEPIYKEGAAVYKAIGEKLIGGWCKAFRVMHGEVCETYTELAFDEYTTGKSNWAAKPGTMIRKCAISQAIRAAFPNEFEGLYTEEEISSAKVVEGEDYTVEEDPVISEEQRKALFAMAKAEFGEKTNEVVKSLIGEFEYDNTRNMPVSVYQQVMLRLTELCQIHKRERSEQEQEQASAEGQSE